MIFFRFRSISTSSASVASVFTFTIHASITSVFIIIYKNNKSYSYVSFHVLVVMGCDLWLMCVFDWCLVRLMGLTLEQWVSFYVWVYVCVMPDGWMVFLFFSSVENCVSLSFGHLEALMKLMSVPHSLRLIISTWGLHPKYQSILYWREKQSRLISTRTLRYYLFCGLSEIFIFCENF